MRNHFIKPYGTYVIAAWAVVMGLQNVARLIYTLATDGTGSQASQTQLFVYQWIGVLFSLAFFAAAAGIWQHQQWGRKLFLLATPIFFALSIFGTFASTTADITPVVRWVLAARYTISILIPWIYLNLPFVTQSFSTEAKDITPND